GIHACVYNQPVEPRREFRLSTKLANACHQLEKDLLRHIARQSLIAMKEIERDGIHLVLIQVIERTKGVPIACAARFDDPCADLAIAQINHQPLRRTIEDLSSIFSTWSGLSMRLCRHPCRHSPGGVQA